MSIPSIYEQIKSNQNKKKPAINRTSFQEWNELPVPRDRICDKKCGRIPSYSRDIDAKQALKEYLKNTWNKRICVYKYIGRRSSLQQNAKINAKWEFDVNNDRRFSPWKE